MKVKICGITNLADARFAAGAGADFLGFIQYPESPRYILPEKAAEISAWVFGAQSVGVFVDETADHVNRISAMAGFDLVQLHGNETVATCEAIKYRIIKVFKVRTDNSFDDIARQIEPYLDCAEYFLLDAFSEHEEGGTGQTIPWDIARELANRYPIILAGGLTPENVGEAIDQAQPAGLDVSSGLESAPGQKDFDLITKFMSAVLQANDSQESPRP
jgi:phosphoribosylanthranilate isomerase